MATLWQPERIGISYVQSEHHTGSYTGMGVKASISIKLLQVAYIQQIIICNDLQDLRSAICVPATVLQCPNHLVSLRRICEVPSCLWRTNHVDIPTVKAVFLGDTPLMTWIYRIRSRRWCASVKQFIVDVHVWFPSSHKKSSNEIGHKMTQENPGTWRVKMMKNVDGYTSMRREAFPNARQWQKDHSCTSSHIPLIEVPTKWFLGRTAQSLNQTGTWQLTTSRIFNGLV